MLVSRSCRSTNKDGKADWSAIGTVAAVVLSLISMSIAFSYGRGTADASLEAWRRSTDDDLKVLKEKKYVAAGVPVGSIVSFAAGELPRLSDGWLPCNGGTYPRADYKELADLLGNTWGDAGSPDRFKVPDLENQFLRGAGGSRRVGSQQADSVNVPPITIESGGAHTHDVYIDTGGLDNSSFDGGGVQAADKAGVGRVRQAATVEGGRHNHTATVAGNGSETRPRNVAVAWLIRAK